MENVLRVFYCVIDPNMPEGEENKLLNALPAHRAGKASRYKFREDRLLSVCSWHLLRFAVKETFGIDAFVETIEANGAGKPNFPAFPGVYFNISHCRMAAACGVGNAPCGVDIETLRKADLKVAKRFMTDEQYAGLLNLPDGAGQDDYFTRAWTEYESVYKSGLKDGYQTVFFRVGDYYLSICSENLAMGLQPEKICIKE